MLAILALAAGVTSKPLTLAVAIGLAKFPQFQ